MQQPTMEQLLIIIGDLVVQNRLLTGAIAQRDQTISAMESRIDQLTDGGGEGAKVAPPPDADGGAGTGQSE
jgi:hypothetical protein